MYAVMEKEICNRGPRTEEEAREGTAANESCSASRRELEADGKKFVVIRHFVGDREPSALMLEIAVNRAKREMES